MFCRRVDGAGEWVRRTEMMHPITCHCDPPHVDLYGTVVAAAVVAAAAAAALKTD